MARQYARGNKAVGECQRSGIKAPLNSLVRDGYYPDMMVVPEWYEGRHPQEELKPVDDPVNLHRPAPDIDSVNAGSASLQLRYIPLTDLHNQTVPNLHMNAPLNDSGMNFLGLESVVQTWDFTDTDGDITTSKYQTSGVDNDRFEQQPLQILSNQLYADGTAGKWRAGFPTFFWIYPMLGQDFWAAIDLVNITADSGVGLIMRVGGGTVPGHVDGIYVMCRAGANNSEIRLGNEAELSYDNPDDPTTLLNTFTAVAGQRLLVLTYGNPAKIEIYLDNVLVKSVTEAQGLSTTYGGISLCTEGTGALGDNYSAGFIT